MEKSKDRMSSNDAVGGDISLNAAETTPINRSKRFKRKQNRNTRLQLRRVYVESSAGRKMIFKRYQFALISGSSM